MTDLDIQLWAICRTIVPASIPLQYRGAKRAPDREEWHVDVGLYYGIVVTDRDVARLS